MRHHTFFPSVTVLAAALLILPSSADACPPPLPGLSSSVPKDGGSYPGNGVLFFSGHEISLDAVKVTVDGAPASFTDASGVVQDGLGGIRVRVDPAPKAGQSVVIEGDFCMPAQGCAPVTIQYTAAAADNEAPLKPENVLFNIYDYVDFKSFPGDCQLDSDLAWYVHIEGPLAAADEARVIYTVEGFRDEGLTDLAFTRSVLAYAPDTAVTMLELAANLGGAAAPDAFCFRVTASDSAGNVANEAALACKPCNYRVDSGMDAPFSTPPEPAWTAADEYPGGACKSGTVDPGTGGAGGGGGGNGGGGGSGGGSGGAGGDGGDGGSDLGQSIERGCRCHIGEHTESTPLPWLALLFGVAGAVRRARRSTSDYY